MEELISNPAQYNTNCTMNANMQQINNALSVNYTHKYSTVYNLA